jgi:flagellar motor switch protein FliN/FliY
METLQDVTALPDDAALPDDSEIEIETGTEAESSDAPQPAAVDPTQSLHEAVIAGLSDVTCPVVVEIGSGTLTVREVVEFGRAAILRMTQVAGADMSLLVKGVILAKGEVVIIDENTAIRVTEISDVPGADAQAEG